MTIYGFRHSFATLMNEKGMDKEVLRELMGHDEFEATDFYYIHELVPQPLVTYIIRGKYLLAKEK